jgi:hypothetical protein
VSRHSTASRSPRTVATTRSVAAAVGAPGGAYASTYTRSTESCANPASARGLGTSSGSVSRRARGVAAYAGTGVASVPGPSRGTSSVATVAVPTRALRASRTDTASAQRPGVSASGRANTTLSPARTVSRSVATRTVSSATAVRGAAPVAAGPPPAARASSRTW